MFSTRLRCRWSASTQCRTWSAPSGASSSLTAEFDRDCRHAMNAGFQFDIEHLTRYLTAHVAGFEGPMSVEKFPGGQSNPTFLLKARSGDYVLRRQPPGALLKSA